MSESLIAHPYQWVQLHMNITNRSALESSMFFQSVFKHLPTLEELLQLVKDVEAQPSNNLSSEKENLLLQYIIIGANTSTNQAGIDWCKVQALFPIMMPIDTLQAKCKSLLKCYKSRQPWMQEEDQILLEIIHQNGGNQAKKKWQLIAVHFNNLNFQKPRRSAKQIRERWCNKLDPNICRNPWKTQEELFFVQLLIAHGRKWAEISLNLSTLTHFRRRTEFSLKYKFNQLSANYGHTIASKIDLSTLNVSSDWSKQVLNMLVGHLEQLTEQVKLKCNQKFSISPLNCDILQGARTIVMVKENKIKKMSLNIFKKYLI